MTIPIFTLDGINLGPCQDWEGCKRAAAWYWGCTPNDVDSVETFDENGDCIEWLLVDGKIVGTIGRPMPSNAELVIFPTAETAELFIKAL